MPTPGGLLKAGDKIVDGEGIVYLVLERTSTSAPYSVWLKRVDGQRIPTGHGGFRSDNIRNRGMEVRLPLETGHLFGKWHLYVPGVDAIQPEPAPKQESIRRRMRPIRVEPCKRPNPVYGEEVDVRVLMNESSSTVITISDDELMDLCIRGLQYLRDKKSGTL